MSRSIVLGQLGNIQSVLLFLMLIYGTKPVSSFSNFTIFTILKTISHPLQVNDQIQMNAIWSWSRLVPMQNIILFFDDTESCTFVHAHYSNISCYSLPPSDCFHSTYNRSYIKCAFDLAQRYAQTSILLFVNGDILLDTSISHTIAHVAARISYFFLVGCRRDYELSPSINISNPEEILRDAAMNSRIHSTTGIDFIAFRTKAPISMPPFLVGVYRWDNWLLSEILLRTNITLIDVTPSVIAIHQQPIAAAGEKPMPHSSRIGALHNDELTKNISGVDYKVGFIHNAHGVLVGDCQKNECWLKDNLNRSEQVLIMRRANPDKYIAVLTVNTGYMAMAWNWICWAKRINFRHYILLAEDLNAYKVLRDAGEPVFITYKQSLLNSSKTEAEYGSFAFQITMAFRVEFLMNVLRAGFHFLSADMDALWLDDPFEYVSHNLSYAIQGQTHKETKMSGGFILVHATPEGRKLWQNVIECQKQNLILLGKGYDKKSKRPPSDFTEQECINNRLNMTKHHLLHPDLFPDGRSFFDLNIPQKHGVVPVVIHGNWLVGLNRKLDRLKLWNLLASTNKSCNPLSNGIPYPNLKKKALHNLRIRVLTYNRLNSFQRLLTSLLAAHYEGDSIALDIYIDRPSMTATPTEKNDWKKVVEYIGDTGDRSPNFRWPHGPLSIVVQNEHVGLLGQWISSSNHSEIQLFLEDDIVVSPHFYSFLRRAIAFYYFNESNYDGQMYGLSLQNQHTVLGKTTGHRIRDIGAELNQTGAPLFFKYQLLGSWGTVFFPTHWRVFLKWMTMVRLDDLHSACTPNLLSTQWWIERYSTGRLWTPWFIRFIFERGWYSLYTNLPNHEAFATSYRDAGLNFNITRGPMNSIVQNLQPSIHFNFTHKPPVFDYHFTRINQPGLLTIRSNLWHRKHFFNQCHIIDTVHASKKATTTKLVRIVANITTKYTTVLKLSVKEHVPNDVNKDEANVIGVESLSLSTNCFKLFLLFELVSVFPIVAMVIALTFFLTRKRGGGRRKVARK